MKQASKPLPDSADLEGSIARVESKIKDVQIQIQAAEAASTSSKTVKDRDYWRTEELQLRTEEQQLRTSSEEKKRDCRGVSQGPPVSLVTSSKYGARCASMLAETGQSLFACMLCSRSELA